MYEDLSDGAPTPFEERSFYVSVAIIEHLFVFVNIIFEQMFVFVRENKNYLHAKAFW